MSVVITGIGAITPLGIDLPSSWNALTNGQNGIHPIKRFDPTGFPVRFGAECPNVDLQPDLLPWLANSLKQQFCYTAAAEAIAMAGVDLSGPRVGISIGSEAARPDLFDLASRLSSDLPIRKEDLQLMDPQAPVRVLQHLTQASGPISVISTACTSSSQAIGEGLLRLRRGEVDKMIVGGVDVLVDPIMITGFSLLGALSTRNADPAAASRPFDVDRDGFVLGEGAGFMVLEKEKDASKRGAEILGRLSGFGCSCNAYRITDSPPDGRGAAQSMIAAMQDANLSPEDIGYINAHGTSTLMNDASETRGIYRAFPDVWRNIPVSSTKSMTGHLVAACGVVEVLFALMAVREGILPPTRNLDNIDPKCQLNHIPKTARRLDIKHAMSNAFGFGGSNGTIVVSK